MEIRQLKWLPGLALAVLLTACASAPTNKPDDALTKAEYAVAQAQQSNAGDNAPKLLYNANQKLDQAKQLAREEDPSEEDYDKARRLAEEATVDAQLAQARSEAVQAQAQTQQVQESIDTLRQELNRKEAQ